jgi:hypothetical protein
MEIKRRGDRRDSSVDAADLCGRSPSVVHIDHRARQRPGRDRESYRPIRRHSLQGARAERRCSEIMASERNAGRMAAQSQRKQKKNQYSGDVPDQNVTTLAHLGPGPHSIKVCVVKKDNEPTTMAKLVGRLNAE